MVRSNWAPHTAPPRRSHEYGKVIDYADRFEDQLSGVDVVIDPVGGDSMARSWQVLRHGGILVAIADEPEGHGGRDDVRSRYFVVEPDGAQLASWPAS